MPCAVATPLLVLESMKMEIAVSAPCDATVTQVLPVAGGRVAAGQALVVLEDTTDNAGAVP